MNYRKATKQYNDKLKPCPFCGERLVTKVDCGCTEYVHPANKCILASADSEYGPLWVPNNKEYIDRWNRRINNERKTST